MLCPVTDNLVTNGGTSQTFDGVLAFFTYTRPCANQTTPAKTKTRTEMGFNKRATHSQQTHTSHGPFRT